MPEFLDLVIWGHEHDCRIEPELTNNNVYISQPGNFYSAHKLLQFLHNCLFLGSSVATSLCLGESIPKHVGLLQIHKKQFNMTPIPLKTVRPFIFRDLVLKSLDDMQEDIADESLTHQARTEKIVEKEIEKMIVEAKELGKNSLIC